MTARLSVYFQTYLQQYLSWQISSSTSFFNLLTSPIWADDQVASTMPYPTRLLTLFNYPGLSPITQPRQIEEVMMLENNTP